MLYAQKKERDNRFKLALRTVIPSLLFVITLFILFFNNDQLFLFFILMAIVSFIITYYNLYVIYNGFDKNVIDPETLVLNIKTFKDIVKKSLKKKKPSTFLMIKLGDLEDINAHYGREQTNITLREAIQTLLGQIDGLGFRNIPAGALGGGIFIVSFNAPYSEVIKKVRPLFDNKEHCYINNIELEFHFALVDADHEINCDIIFSHLFDLINQSNDENLSLEDHFHKERIIEKRVKEAISSQSLSLQYQKVISTNDDVILEFSAKLIDSQNRLIHHSDILPVINRLGLEKDFYLLVIEGIFKEIQTKAISEKFSMNITAFAFRHKEVMATVLKWLKSYQIRPGQMLLVISETRFYKHVERYKSIIDTYRESGILIGFSNVGSVNPVLEYLKSIDVDFIKYDKSLTEVTHDPIVATVFQALNDLAKNRNIKTWATMIENQATQTKLEEMGIDYMQGRHIALLEQVNTL